MYTIVILDGGDAKRNRVFDYLNERIAKDGRFTARLMYAVDKGMPGIHIKPVRLTKAKPYCGQHPGPCEVGPFGVRKKMVGRWLEWDDWVKFHNLINSALNRLKANANVWTNPHDCKGKMWIRKGREYRIRYDYTEEYSFGRPVRIWNTGTPDQFNSAKLMRLAS